MLLQFKISNYMSIKDEIVFSFLANSNKEKAESLIDCNGVKVLPVISVFGANGTGKSSIYSALCDIFSLVGYYEERDLLDGTSFTPFMFDEKTKNNPTIIELVFVYKGKKYKYGFSADVWKIIDEYLYEYKSSRAALIFERKNTDSYKFTFENKGLGKYAENNPENRLFLCAALKSDNMEIKNVYEYLSTCFFAFSNHYLAEDNMFADFFRHRGNDPEVKKFTMSLLKITDPSIADYVCYNPEKQYQPIRGCAVAQNNLRGAEKFKIIREIRERGEVRSYELPASRESSGTRLLFAYSNYIYDAFINGYVIIIDDLNGSLHPKVIRSLIEKFQDPAVNKAGAQLFFTSQDVSLLDLRLFRRDEVYFLNKNTDTVSTELHPLSMFSARITDNIQKGYLQGKYGKAPL